MYRYHSAGETLPQKGQTMYKQNVEPYKCFQSQRRETSQRVRIPRGKGRLLQTEQPSFNSGVLSLYLVCKIIEHLFMITICLTLNEGQGRYN